MTAADLFPAPTTKDVSPGRKAAELRRELAMRRKVYPDLVERGKLRQDVADTRILILEAILEDYLERYPLLRDQGGPPEEPDR